MDLMTAYKMLFKQKQITAKSQRTKLTRKETVGTCHQNETDFQ